MKTHKYGIDVYIIAFVILSVHIANIVGKFMGKDIGVSVPESLQAIQSQIEHIGVAWVLFRSQRQVNKAHQRVNAMQNPKIEGL